MRIQLANVYDPAKKYKPDYWYATPKFDGVRAVFIPYEGFLTRNGKRIAGLRNMENILTGYCERHKLSFVDGELTVKGKTFQAAQSLILSAWEIKSDVEFHVFAVGGNFKATNDMLDMLPNFPGEKIFSVHSMVCPNDFASVEEICKIYTAQGYEGIVLRDPSVPYLGGRNESLLKYKLFKEADLKVVAVNPQERNGVIMAGSITVEGIVDGVKVRTRANATNHKEDKISFWADRKKLKGRIITVKYQSLTDKPARDGFYRLRFANIIGLKEDRDFDMPEPVTATPKFTGRPSNCKFHKNGDVEIAFQPQLVSKPMNKSFFPSESQMAEWKSKLLACSNVDEGIRLMTDIKLTEFEILAFAAYLRISFRGDERTKAEIVKTLAEKCLGARKEKKNLPDFRTITQVKITDSDTEVNKYLAGEWVLLDVCNREGRPVFVIGLPYQFDTGGYCTDLVYPEEAGR